MPARISGVSMFPPCAPGVMLANTSPIDSCVVDQAFPNLSKVRPTGNCSKIPLQNVKVQISQ